MKISILLPYKENYSPEYAGAVSIFVNSVTKISKYKKILKFMDQQIIKKYFQIIIKISNFQKNFINQSKNYVNKFLKIQEREKPDIIEVHNRPIYIRDLEN